jgi:hypothetical protein
VLHLPAAKNNDLMYDCTFAATVTSSTQHIQRSETLPPHITLRRRHFFTDTILPIYNLAALVHIYLPLW